MRNFGDRRFFDMGGPISGSLPLDEITFIFLSLLDKVFAEVVIKLFLGYQLTEGSIFLGL